ncbi:MAG: redoxin domain-containing protein [Anaerolineae bacterium]|nr:redoxin domain-containing protein [Anaerolineae bacterium]
MTEQQESCVTPARGPIAAPVQDDGAPVSAAAPERKPIMQARVGKPAPDFEANAFHQGSFKPVKLSDHKGRWVVLCFYPGDFTFV